ncbi:hypothetical protein Llab_0705 [Lactococcus lactis]|nr:hypothetical protein Llab_0705 [Lactococcus lactis]
MEYDSLCLTPNIKETLKVLKSKNIKIHIMSNRGTKELEKILRKLEIQNLCDTATGKSDSFREYGDVLKHISNFYCIDNTKCLAVSNTKQGVDMGRKLSMKTCCISWGRLDVDTLAKNSPDILISQSQNISSKILAI